MGKLLVDDNCGRWPSYIFLPAFLLVVGYALVNFAFMFKGQSVALVGAFDKFGYDFRDFHRAGKYLEIGKDPYSWERFVTPPFSAVIMATFSSLQPNVAIKLFFIINVSLIFAGLLLCVNSFSLTRYQYLIFLCVSVSALFSYPVYFLLHRGNIDGIVFFFLFLGIYFSTLLPKWQNELVAGLAFAVSVQLKLYPVLIILPILANRRWRLMLFMVLAVLILGLLTPGLWLDFFEKIVFRNSIYTVQENGSLVNTIMSIFYIFKSSRVAVPDPVKLVVAKTVAYSIYFLLLITLCSVDARKGDLSRYQDFGISAVFYIPFMIVVPVSVYHYEFVHLLSFIPLACWLKEKEFGSQYTFLLMLGAVLCQSQAAALYILTKNVSAYFLPGYGALLIVILGVFLRIQLAKGYFKNHYVSQP